MRALLFIGALSFLFLAWQFPGRDGWKAKVNPSLLAKASSGGEVEFLVILEAQAGLSASRRLATKEEKGRYVYDELRAVASQSQGEVRRLFEKAGAPYRSFFIINAVWGRGGLPLLRSLAQLPGVRAIQDNPSIRLAEPFPAETGDGISPRGNVEWGIARIGADQVWALGYTGQGVVIGGQDTGYEWDHPAIIDTYRGWNGDSASHDYNWHDAIHEINPLHGGTSDPSENPCGLDSPVPCDDHNHGTHTMGTMTGAEGDNGNSIGVAPGASWIACRNMERGYGTPATYIECFEWFLAPANIQGENPDPDKAPHVINNSWSCPELEGCNPGNFATMEAVVDNLKAAGIFVAVSAGNSGNACSTVNTPAAMFESSFSVGATSQTDTIAGFSSRGPVLVDGSGRLKPNVAAPGVGVRSAVRNGGYATFSGTSMAGPHVAGLVALMISANPDLAGQVETLETLVEQTAKPMLSSQDCGPFSGLEVPNAVYGYGRVDALAAVQAALEITGHDSPAPKAQVRVFPNPTSGQVFLQMDGIGKEAQVQVFAASGQLVFSARWDAASGNLMNVGLSALPAGIYWYRVVTGQRQYEGKLIRQ